MSSLSQDPTLTVGNVTRAVEKVTVDKRRQMWGNVVLSRRIVEEIYSSHSSEEEKLRSCIDTYITYNSDSSWEHLVQALYYSDEMAAAKEAKVFLQPKGGWCTTCLIDGLCVILSNSHYATCT